MLAGLTAGAARVYEELCTLAQLDGGKGYSSDQWLASATVLGRATVASALPILEDSCFLVRQHGFPRTDGYGLGLRWELSLRRAEETAIAIL